jgi:cytochrome c biogenesis protein CcdA
MVFKIAAIFLVILCSLAIFLAIFVQEQKSILDIVAIVSMAISGLIFLSYVVKKRKYNKKEMMDNPQ